jgi:hypothetical protein
MSIETADSPVNSEKVPHQIAHLEKAEPFARSREVGGGLPPAPDLSPEDEARLWRKIDKRLMPMLALMYLMSFLDRGT